VHATVSILNVLHIPDFYRDWVGRGLLQPGEMQLNLLYNPSYLNIQGLPAAMKDKVEHSYRELITEHLVSDRPDIAELRETVESVVRFMREKDSDELEVFRLQTKALDFLRNERFEDLFPGLSELMESDPGADRVFAAAARMTIGDDAGALAEMRQALKGATSSVAVADLRRVEDAIAAGKTAPALLELAGALGVRVGPAFGPFLLKQWRLQRESGDLAAALDTMAQFIELQPESILAYIDRKLAESGEGGTIRIIPAGASADLGDLFSGRAVVYWARGVARRALDDGKRALEDFEQALELDPEAVLLARCRRDLATTRPSGTS
jgi:tetratricopeptide (TPR) repeat protein